MENVYTTTQIKEAWEQYQEAHCWRYMKPGGQVVARMKAPDTSAGDVIQCKMVKVCSVMDFPKYLEIMGGS